MKKRTNKGPETLAQIPLIISKMIGLFTRSQMGEQCLKEAWADRKIL